MLHPNFSNDVFVTLQSTRIFKTETFSCISGYIRFLEDYTPSDINLDLYTFDDFFKNEFVPCNAYTLASFLQSFDFHIQTELSFTIADFSYSSKLVCFVENALKNYESELHKYDTVQSLDQNRVIKNISNTIKEKFLLEVLKTSTYENNAFFELIGKRNFSTIYDVNSFFYYLNIFERKRVIALVTNFFVKNIIFIFSYFPLFAL